MTNTCACTLNCAFIYAPKQSRANTFNASAGKRAALDASPAFCCNTLHAQRFLVWYLDVTAPTTPRTEQLYSHIAALAIAKALHAELVVPIAYTLDSSGNFTAFDARSILDVPRMRAAWARAGMTLHAVRQTWWCIGCATSSRQAPASGLNYFPPVNTAADRERAFPRYVYEGVHHESVVNVPHVFNAQQPLEQLVDAVVSAIGARSRAMPPSPRALLGSTVLVNLPCTFRSIHNPRYDYSQSAEDHRTLHSAPESIAFAATGIALSPALEAMAATMLRTLRAGGPHFYGLVAADPTDVQALLGRDPGRLKLLLAAAQEYLRPPRPCYLGMEWLHDVHGRTHLDMQDRVVAASPCTSLVTKYQLLDAALLQGAMP